MRGNKTTAIEPVQKINKLLKKYNITNTSYGIIVQVKGRRDHRASVKHRLKSGCHELSITGKRYKQEYRIYDKVSTDVLMNILKENLGERFRIL